VILSAHTHDAIPRAIEIGSTLLLSSGSHGKYLGRIDLEVKGGRVTGHASNLIPVFADVVEPDKEMAAKIAEVRAPFEKEASRVLGKAKGLLYRRGNFNGTWDDAICAGIIAERDTEISLSPGFRWGATLLPGDDITVDDLYNETAMSYPSVYRLEMTGAQIKDIMEDVCDNLFNKDPFFQQGGDMVRVGGMSYACAPDKEIGSRISDMRLTRNGEPIDAGRKYVVGGWASVNQSVEGPPIYDLMEKYISSKGGLDVPDRPAVRILR
jgi:sulfur-oxidizing protein SoxB